MKRILAAITCLFVSATAPLAHEFWISPEAYEVDAGTPLQAHLRVGQDLKGSIYAYIPNNFKRFDLVSGDFTMPVKGRAGDRPALNMTVPGEGLVTVVHVTRDYKLTYTEWQKFINFTTHKDFSWAVEEHRARGLSEDKVLELYSRHAKSLMAVGDGAGSDSEVGLETEIVAGANPFTDDLTDGFPVTVLYLGAPRADVQIELFEKDPAGVVSVTLHRTDAEGHARLPVKAGYEYLVDSVVLRPMDVVSDGDPAWKSLWASLTFKVPS